MDSIPIYSQIQTTELIFNCTQQFLRIPNGKRIWFWYETAPSDASELRNRKQSQNYSYSQQSGPILHIIWTD